MSSMPAVDRSRRTRGHRRAGSRPHPVAAGCRRAPIRPAPRSPPTGLRLVPRRSVHRRRDVGCGRARLGRARSSTGAPRDRGACATHVDRIVARSRCGRSRCRTRRCCPPASRSTASEGDDDWWDFQLDGYGTWLWAAVAHAERHGVDRRTAGARRSRLTVDYLVSSWDRPCYDWWEEHIEQVHVSTLGCVVAGLRAAAALGRARRRTARDCAAAAAAADARAPRRSRRVVDGHLVKWIGSRRGRREPRRRRRAARRVDATQLRLGAGSVARARSRSSTVDGGVHRFLADTLLRRRAVAAAQLHARARARSAAGDRDRARRDCCAGRLDGRATTARCPNRSTTTCSTPGVRRRMGGALGHGRRPAALVATPCSCGSPSSSDVDVDGGPPMIRHRPFGLGASVLGRHRTALTGRPGRGRAACARRPRARRTSSASTLEWSASTATARRRPARPLERVARTLARAGGRRRAPRLGAGAARARVRRVAAVALDGLRAGERLRYRFVVDATAERDPLVRDDGQRRGPRAHRSCDEVRDRPRRSRQRDRRSATARPYAPHPLRPPARARASTSPGSASASTPSTSAAPSSTRSSSSSTRARAPSARPTCRCRSRMSWAATRAGGFHVRTSRRVWFDVGASDAAKLWIEAETGPDGGARARASTTARPREVLAAFLARPAVPRSCRTGCSGSGRAATSGTRRPRSCARSTRTATTTSRSAPSSSRRGATRAPSRPGATPATSRRVTVPSRSGWRTSSSRADGAWPDPKGMVDELHSRDDPAAPLADPAHQDAAASHRAGGGGCRRRRSRDGVLIREPAPDGSLRPYRNRGWWFPLGAHARPHRRARRALVDREAPLPRRGGRHRRLQDRRRRARLGPRAASTSTADAATRRTTRFPVALREGLRRPAAAGGQGAGHVQPRGLHRAARRTARSGPATRTRPGRRSAGRCSRDCPPPHRGIVYWGWDLAGFCGDVPTAELYLRSAAAAAFVPIMQYHSEFNHHRTPSRDRTPWNIAERSGDDRVLPVFRAFAAAARATRARTSRPRRRGRSRAGVAAHAPALLRPPRRPRGLGASAAVDARRDLLVAPVVDEGATEHEVALPPGEWVDVWTGRAVAGAALLRRAVPLDEVPVYCRAQAWARLAPVLEDRE